MAIFRDPRQVAASAYTHLMAHKGNPFETMEAFAAEELPVICKWVAIRYILFSGWHDDQSEEFWYEDALADPSAWHYRWYNFVGVQLPENEVNLAAIAAVDNDFDLDYKHADKHPSQEHANTTEVREFDVSPEMREFSDAVLRKWPPPMLLANIGL